MAFKLSVVIVAAHDLQDAADVSEFARLANEMVSVLGDFVDVRVGRTPVEPQARRHPDAKQPARFAARSLLVPDEILLVLGQANLDHGPGPFGHVGVFDL